MHNIDVITNTSKVKTINIDQLLKDYTLDTSLFTDLDDKLLDIADKWERLPLPYKIIMILYAENESLRDVGEILGVSHTTVNKFIKEIRTWLCG